jgi:ABC-type sugar transport system, permease component
VTKMSSIKRRKKVSDIIAFILILLGAILVLIPLYWMLRTSLMDNVEINVYPPSLLPKNWLFSNYPEALTTFRFDKYLINTLAIVIPVIIGVVVTASLAAYAFARLKFPLKNLWFSLIISSMLMPFAVTLIPTFLAWSKLGAYNTYYPLIIPAFLGGGAFNIFLLRQFLMTIPKELDESATIDGAGYIRILNSILLPLIKPAIIVVVLFTFMNVWNDLMGPVVYLADPDKYTIAIGLNTFRGVYGTDWKAVMAASCVSVLPAVILYLFGQKYFLEGIVLTGIKA